MLGAGDCGIVEMNAGRRMQTVTDCHGELMGGIFESLHSTAFIVLE
jgi:hypothetical protein